MDETEPTAIPLTKQELFNQNPDLFMCVDDLPLFVTRDPETKEIKHVSIRLTNYKEACLVEVEVREALMAFRMSLKQRSAKTGIVGANGQKPGFRIPFTKGH